MAEEALASAEAVTVAEQSSWEASGEGRIISFGFAEALARLAIVLTSCTFGIGSCSSFAEDSMAVVRVAKRVACDAGLVIQILEKASTKANAFVSLGEDTIASSEQLAFGFLACSRTSLARPFAFSLTAFEAVPNTFHIAFKEGSLAFGASWQPWMLANKASIPASSSGEASRGCSSSVS